MNTALILLFIRSIPDLIKLLQALDKIRVDSETDRKVTDDLKSLHQALDAKDPDKVTAIFNS